MEIVQYMYCSHGVAEMCPDPPIRNMIRNMVLCCGPSAAGVYEVPFCNHSYPKHRCDLLARVISHYAYDYAYEEECESFNWLINLILTRITVLKYLYKYSFSYMQGRHPHSKIVCDFFKR